MWWLKSCVLLSVECSAANGLDHAAGAYFELAFPHSAITRRSDVGRSHVLILLRMSLVASAKFFSAELYSDRQNWSTVCVNNMYYKNVRGSSKTEFVVSSQLDTYLRR